MILKKINTFIFLKIKIYYISFYCDYKIKKYLSIKITIKNIFLSK